MDKIIHLCTFNRTKDSYWEEWKFNKFYCYGDKCDTCKLRFECYSDKEMLRLEIEFFDPCMDPKKFIQSKIKGRIVELKESDGEFKELKVTVPLNTFRKV